MTYRTKDEDEFESLYSILGLLSYMLKVRPVPSAACTDPCRPRLSRRARR